MRHRYFKTVVLILYLLVCNQAYAALAYVDADFTALDDSASTVNEFRGTFDVEVGGVKVADGEIVANNFTGLFVGDGLEFSMNKVNSVDTGEPLIRLTLDSEVNPPGPDPVSTADVSFILTPVNGWGSAGMSFSSYGSTMAVDNINDLTFSGAAATIQDDESVVNLINGANATPVAFVSGADVDFIVANWDGNSGFKNATHRENWSVDIDSGVSTNFTYVTGVANSLVREQVVWGVEMAPLVDMKITKSVTDPTPDVSDTVTFTLMVENIGVHDASNVAVTDIVPNGFSYVPGSISGADTRSDTSPAGTGLSWVINNFAVGDPTATLTFQAIVNAP